MSDSTSTSEHLPRIEVTLMITNNEPTKYREEVFITGIYGFGEDRFNEVKDSAIETAWEEAEEYDYPENAFSATFACSNFVDEVADTGLGKSRYVMCEKVRLINYLIQEGKKEPQKVSAVNANTSEEAGREKSELMRLVRLLSEQDTKEAINSLIKLMDASFADPGFSVYDQNNFLLARVTEEEERRVKEVLKTLRDAT